jgi:heptosyltransferase-2
LLRLPNWIGDAVMTLPALRALLRPDDEYRFVAHPRAHPVYRLLVGEDRLLAAGGATAPFRLASTLRAFAPHRAVVFPASFAGGLLARLSGAPRRLGRRAGPRDPFFTDLLPPEDRETPLWRTHLDLARAAGGHATGRPDFTLEPGAAAREAAARLVPMAGAVALAPGAVYGPAKQWPVPAFAELADRLRRRGIPVVAVGGPADAADTARLGADVDLAGRTDLAEAIAVLARCRAAVTNDSGAMHLARAAGTPVVALFGSSSPRWTGPTEPEGRALTLGLACSPCFARRCPLPGERRLRCLRDLTVDEVDRNLQEVLEGAA